MTLRDVLIASGAIVPQGGRDHAARLGLPVLLIDDRGRRMAKRHVEHGARGVSLMAIPPSLAPWHQAFLARRERAARS